MSRLLGRPVKTFCMGFSGDKRFDETYYARLVAKAFKTDHLEHIVTPASFDLVEKLVDLHDGPFGDSSAIPTYIISELTRQHVTVALTGDGGDELFCGYSRFLAGEWAEHIPKILGRFNQWASGGVSPGAGSRDFIARLRRFASVASLPLADRMTAWCSYFLTDLREILHPDLVQELDLEAPLNWSRNFFESAKQAPVMAQILSHNFETYLPYDLLVKADRASMAHGLELRSPFLDTKLIEYAARLPASWVHRGRNTKWILKEAFSDLLPSEIMNRKKMGFGLPLGTWFRNDLRGTIEDYLGHSSSQIYNYLNQDYVQKLLKDHMRGAVDNSAPLWLLLTFEVWLRSMKN